MTVQLDGAGRRLGGAAAGAAARAGKPGGRGGAKEVPVFVDDSGRRGRTFRRVGVLMGVACAVYAVVIAITLLSGNSAAPWLPMPDGRAGQVDTKPLTPADTAPAPTEPGGAPDPGASGSASGAEAARARGGTPTPGPERAGQDRTPGTTAGTGSTAPGKPGKPGRPGAVKPTGPAAPPTTPAVPKPPADPSGQPSTGSSPPPADPSGQPSPDPVAGGTDTTAAGPVLGTVVGRVLGGARSALPAVSLESSVL
ncbi:hypothetical protein [Streptomyces sp. NPDC049813]|uniref:hypothetical protein n=1 Tax=Streptomyces sp. NPDC049813 TaxID=3365597 RepID=UPI00379E6E69